MLLCCSIVTCPAESLHSSLFAKFYIFLQWVEEQRQCYYYTLVYYKNMNVQQEEISHLLSEAVLARSRIERPCQLQSSHTYQKQQASERQVRESHWGWRVQCLMTDELMRHIWQGGCLVHFTPHGTDRDPNHWSVYCHAFSFESSLRGWSPANQCGVSVMD